MPQVASLVASQVDVAVARERERVFMARLPGGMFFRESRSTKRREGNGERGRRQAVLHELIRASYPPQPTTDGHTLME